MKLLRDTWLIFVANVRATLRVPVWVIIGLFQPICYLLLFAPLLKKIANTPGFPPGGALTVFTPGLLIMMALFGTLFVGFGLIGELREGVIERLRVTPVSRMALLLGRALRDVLMLLIQVGIMLLVAWPLGLRANLSGILISLGLVALIGLLMASCSYGLALALREENSLASTLNTISLPLMLLSGIVLPMSLAPAWLRDLSDINPFSHAVDATRALFTGNIGEATVLEGFLIMAALALVALWWAARSFRRATA